MPTVPLTIQIADVSRFLASADAAKSGLFNHIPIDPRLPIMLYVENEILRKIYTANSTWENLQKTADYVYALCGKYGFKAVNIINGGGGGTSSGVTPSQYYPIYITELNFSSATFYPNTRIFGTNVIIYLNEINRYLLPAEFTVSAAGIDILIAGFDSLNNSYNLIIEKYVTS